MKKLKDQKIAVIFLDLSKVFDKVYHSVLMSKLQKRIKSDLNERKRRTRIETMSSNSVDINCWVPQGTVL